MGVTINNKSTTTEPPHKNGVRLSTEMKNGGEFDHEIPLSQTTEKPMAP